MPRPALVHVLPGSIWAAFHRDGKHVLAVQSDFSIAQWELASGRLVRRFVGHNKMPAAFDLSGDGRWMLSLAPDSTLRLWDLEQGKEVDQVKAPADAAFANAALTADGKQAAVRAGLRSIMLWDLADGRFKIARCWELPEGERGGLLRFTPDGTELVVVSTHAVRWYARAADKAVRRLDLDRLADANVNLLSADARRLVVTPRMGDSLLVLELPSGRQWAQLPAPDDMAPGQASVSFGTAALSPDGRRLVVPVRRPSRGVGRLLLYALPGE